MKSKASGLTVALACSYCVTRMALLGIEPAGSTWTAVDCCVNEMARVKWVEMARAELWDKFPYFPILLTHFRAQTWPVQRKNPCGPMHTACCCRCLAEGPWHGLWVDACCTLKHWEKFTNHSLPWHGCGERSHPSSARARLPCLFHVCGAVSGSCC